MRKLDGIEMRREFLEVVNEDDEVIGTETRERIHREGLLHREVHVFFVTPNKEIIFQHRSKDKDTYPNLLDASVGGHVEPRMDYEDSAIKECEEETGIIISKDDLIPIKKIKSGAKDDVTGKINYSFKMEFAYVFRGKIEDLKIEKGKAEGFESWPIQKLFNLSEKEKRKFIPMTLSREFLEIYRKIGKLV